MFMCLRSCHILVKGEGRNDPFSVMKTFLEEPPEVVIYDFACALEEYASNRDPYWFRNTLFVIDRFHWRNHHAYAAVQSALSMLYVDAAWRCAVITTRT